MTSARSWGIDARLLTPAEIAELVPFVDPDVVLGGYYTPSVSVVDSLQAGTLMRQEAIDKGALTVLANTEVARHRGRRPVRSARSSRTRAASRPSTSSSPVACGALGIAAMAGATIPLTPAVHQMVDVGPIDALVETNQEVAFPIVRDMDTFCYERQSAGSMEVGSYAHRPIFHHPDEIPSNEEAALSPTELPFTADDFDPQMEQAIELMEVLGDAEIKYAINGLLSLTPDGMPVLGETVEVRNLWSAAAMWIKEGPAIAQLVAEWMTHGYPHLCDPHSSDISRFYDHERTEHHIYARCAEHYNKTYGIVHPREQWASQRGMRRSPFVGRQEELGAVFFDARGWERAQWYGSNADLLDRYAGRCEPRPHEWDARWWSPITNAEHLHLREHVGMVDLTPFNEFDIEGPGAVEYLQRLTVNNVDVAVGRSVYTPLLTPGGGFRADLTIMRLGAEHYRIVTGRVRRRARPLLVPPPPPRRRFGDVHRPHVGTVHDRRVGTEGGGDDGAGRLRLVTPAGRSTRRRSRTARSATCSSTACRARCSASPTSARAAGRCTRRPIRACACGTRSARPASSTTSARSASACTP